MARTQQAGTIFSLGLKAATLAGVFGLLLWSAAASAGAFTVTGVPVDQTAGDARAARDAAIDEGERKALRILFDRLTMPGDQARLPKPADRDIAALVEGFEVEQERSSAGRYIARLTVAFRPSAIRDLLKNAGVPFAEASTRPVLIVPILIDGTEKLLWEDENPWRRAWSDAARQGVLVPWTVAALGPNDPVVTADQALAAKPGSFDFLVQRAGAADAVVAVATRVVGSLSVRLIRGDTASAPEVVQGEAGETPDKLLTRGVMRISAQLDDAWKRDNLVTFGQSATFEAMVELRGLEDWLKVRRMFADMPQIQKTTVKSLNRHGALVALDYVGEIGQFRSVLMQRGLSVGGSETAPTLRLASAQP